RRRAVGLSLGSRAQARPARERIADMTETRRADPPYDPEPRDRLAPHGEAGLQPALDERGHAILPGILTTPECRALAALYPQERHFRSRVHMARHGFGKGEYRYFGYPLPEIVAKLR